MFDFSAVFQIVRLPGDQKTALTGESLYLGNLQEKNTQIGANHANLMIILAIFFCISVICDLCLQMFSTYQRPKNAPLQPKAL